LYQYLTKEITNLRPSIICYALVQNKKRIVRFRRIKVRKKEVKREKAIEKIKGVDNKVKNKIYS